MDPHWGGNKHTMDKIKEGKYKDRTRQLKLNKSSIKYNCTNISK